MYRNICCNLAKEMRFHLADWPEGNIRLVYTFYAPKGCRWDDDAKEAAFKTGQDGIALAMGVDDRNFKVSYIHKKSETKVGRVIVQTVD